MTSSLTSSLTSSPISSPATALVARDVARSYSGRTVLDGIDLVAPPGRVVAVIGENGAGKSTLLRLLAGVEEPDRGTIDRPEDTGFLPQEPTFPVGATVGSVLAEALAPLHALVRRLEALAHDLGDAVADEEYAALLERAVRHDAWDADRRAEEAAARLGLGTLDRDRQVATLSGGQRSRLALAALVARRPACLVLDEPTNHLDDDAVAWWETTLRTLPGAVVVASHDRVFLDRVADQIVDLDPVHGGSDGRGSRVYGRASGRGPFTAVLEARAEARRRWEETYDAQRDQVDALRRAVTVTARQVAPNNRPPRDNDRFIYAFKGARVQRTVARRVRDAERRLELLERSPVPRPPRPLRFTAGMGPADQAAAEASVRVRGLVVPGRLRVDHLEVGAGEHLLVTGPNGSGKSTLLGVVAGGRPPGTSGEVSVHARRVGYLPQDVRFRQPSRTALDLYAATGADAPLRDLGLLTGRDAARPVGQLSHGQRRRVALALVLAREPDLVLLDEPTNHLSLALADELEQAVGGSRATVLVASHDRWLRDRWEGRTLSLTR